VEAPLVEGEVDAPRMLASVDDEEEDAACGSRWKRAKSALVNAGGGKTADADAAEKLCNGNVETNDDNVDDGNDVDASRSSTSPAEGQAAGAPSKEKVGVPIFRDELGTRRMYLAVELGTIYRPRDVIIQVTVHFTGVRAALPPCPPPLHCRKSKNFYTTRLTLLHL